MKRAARILAILTIVVTAGPALAGDDDGTSLDDIPHITIVGSAHEEVPPDLATITLGVVTEQPTAPAAADETAAKAQAVVAAAEALGVAARDIQTQSLTLTQTFDNVKDTDGVFRQVPRGFEAANIVRVRIHDLARAGTIAQGLIGQGANRFDGIDFSLEHPERVHNRLIADAVTNAQAQARAVAQAAGVKLGRVLQIERPDDGHVGPSVAFKFARAAADASMPVEAGVSDVSVEIEVTWAIDAS